MAERGRLRLLVWCLAAFHAGLLLLIGVVVLYLRRDLGRQLDDVGTAVGLSLFAGLWFLSWLGTRRALFDGWILLPRMFLAQLRPPACGVKGGAMTGALAAVSLVIAAMVGGLISGDTSFQGFDGAATFVAFYLVAVVPIGALAGAIAGAGIGLLFGILDGLLLWAALSIVGPDEPLDLGEEAAAPQA